MKGNVMIGKDMVTGVQGPSMKVQMNKFKNIVGKVLLWNGEALEIGVQRPYRKDKICKEEVQEMIGLVLISRVQGLSGMTKI